MDQRLAEARIRGLNPPKTEFPANSTTDAGQLVEISGRGVNARLSTAAHLLLEAQLAGETCAWIQAAETSGPYPPDLALAGIDLESLAILHLPPTEGPRALLRAAEWLLASGGYGLVVVDLSGLPRPRGHAWSARLHAQVRAHRCRLLLLTDSPEHRPSLGPRISLRLAPRRSPTLPEGYRLDVHVLKNKQGELATRWPAIWRPPIGAADERL